MLVQIPDRTLNVAGENSARANEVFQQPRGQRDSMSVEDRQAAIRNRRLRRLGFADQVDSGRSEIASGINRLRR
jgi:hypothetical protein